MLKKGHVYKVVVDAFKNIHGEPRTMIFSPFRDISANEIRNWKGGCIKCIVRINLVGDINFLDGVGFAHFMRLERPNTKEDFKEIKRILEKYKFLKYNKKFNKLEGYENYI